MILNNKAEVDERIVIVPHRSHSFSLAIGRAAYHKDGNVLFLFEMGDDLAVLGYKNVYAHDFLGDILMKRALTQLHKYVEDNLQNVDMYRYDGFWKGALLNAGRIIVPGEHMYSLQMQRVAF